MACGASAEPLHVSKLGLPAAIECVGCRQLALLSLLIRKRLLLLLRSIASQLLTACHSGLLTFEPASLLTRLLLSECMAVAMPLLGDGARLLATATVGALLSEPARLLAFETARLLAGDAA